MSGRGIREGKEIPIRLQLRSPLPKRFSPRREELKMTAHIVTPHILARKHPIDRPTRFTPRLDRPHRNSQDLFPNRRLPNLRAYDSYRDVC